MRLIQRAGGVSVSSVASYCGGARGKASIMRLQDLVGRANGGQG